MRVQGPVGPGDMTAYYTKQLLAMEQTLPTLSELKTYFQQGLGVEGNLGLPVPDQVYQRLFSGDADIASLACKESDTGAETLAYAVSAALTVPIVTSDDTSQAGAVDTFLSKRNSTRASATQKALRLDLLVLVGSAVLFKGEDKADGGDFGKAEEELIRKLKEWSAVYHGKLEYLLCYASVGSSIQFYALTREDNSLVPLLGPLDFTGGKGRLLVMKAAFKVYSIIQRQAQQLPPGCLLGATLQRATGGSVTLWDDHIEKHLPSVSKAQFKFLKQVYAVAANCEFLVHATEGTPKLSEDGEYLVRLKPRGVPLGGELAREVDKLAKEEELRHAVRCLLLALQHLHQQGYVHRDVCWDNVVRTTHNKYVLIDLETVAKAGQICTQRLLGWSDGEALQRGRYTKQSDLYLVSNMMSGFELSAEGQDFQHLLQGKRFTSAWEALQHPWFRQPGAA